MLGVQAAVEEGGVVEGGGDGKDREIEGGVEGVQVDAGAGEEGEGSGDGKGEEVEEVMQGAAVLARTANTALLEVRVEVQVGEGSGGDGRGREVVGGVEGVHVLMEARVEAQEIVSALCERLQ